MKCLLIANPASGRGNLAKIKTVQSVFKKKKAGLDVYLTKKQGDAINAAKLSKHDVVIAAGGDGTVNEVVNGLMKKRKRPLLGVIPLGTENVFAQEMKIPRNPVMAAKIVLSGKKKEIDIGKAKDRYFTLMAGIGFDAHVASKIQPFLKRLLGRAVYPLTAWNELFRCRHAELSIMIDRKKRVKGSYVVAGNAKLYGRDLKVTYKASISDGVLDVCIFKGKDIPGFIRFAFGIMTRNHKIPEIEYLKAKEVYVSSKEKVLCHVDCEVIGTTPVRIKAYPKAITVMC